MFRKASIVCKFWIIIFFIFVLCIPDGVAAGKIPKESLKVYGQIERILVQGKIVGPEKMIEKLQEIIDKYPDREVAIYTYYIIAVLQESEKEKAECMRKGLETYHRVMEKQDNKVYNGNLYNWIAGFYMYLGEKEKAIEAYKNLVDGEYDEIIKPRARFQLSSYYAEQGLWPEAQEQYQKLSPTHQRRISHRFPEGEFGEIKPEKMVEKRLKKQVKKVPIIPIIPGILALLILLIILIKKKKQPI